VNVFDIVPRHDSIEFWFGYWTEFRTAEVNHATIVSLLPSGVAQMLGSVRSTAFDTALRQYEVGTPPIGVKGIIDTLKGVTLLCEHSNFVSLTVSAVGAVIDFSFIDPAYLVNPSHGVVNAYPRTGVSMASPTLVHVIRAFVTAADAFMVKAEKDHPYLTQLGKASSGESE